jgi:hypothetical protein
MRPRTLTTATTALAPNTVHTPTPHSSQADTRPAPRTDTPTLRAPHILRTHTQRQKHTSHAHSTPPPHYRTHTAHILHVLKGRQPGHHRRKAAPDLVASQVQVPARTHMHHHSPPRQASTQPTHACCCWARALTTVTTALTTHHGSHTHYTLVKATHDPHHAPTHSLTQQPHMQRTHTQKQTHNVHRRCKPHTAHRASKHAKHTLHVRQRRQPGHHRRKAAADLVVLQVQVPARTQMYHHSPPRQGSTQPTHAC